ncbi:hypothetical protein Q2K19_31730 [Micromonospora soli]|uniref:hypothetical protein n=1 Tax=Micromonospora sp. NBRC 110009 TaxID=3061627 RepID=UPI002673CE8A|nr:hypothetical protein [Micromonospora sp. NBRC 110009]WKT98663.1 hypothetical protein Q2K19_31730 [Micromonospora sp. NBRC 110009]
MTKVRHLKDYLDWVTNLMTEMSSERLGLPLAYDGFGSGACSAPGRHTGRSALSRRCTWPEGPQMSR